MLIKPKYLITPNTMIQYHMSTDISPIHIWYQYKTSIRPFTNIITNRVIVTSHKHITTVTNNTSTSNPPRILPDNLRIMPALLPLLARIRGVRIVLLFSGPYTHCVPRRPRRPTAPKYVLAKLEIVLRERMLQFAIRFPLVRPPPRVFL